MKIDVYIGDATWKAVANDYSSLCARLYLYLMIMSFQFTINYYYITLLTMITISYYYIITMPRRYR